MDTTNNKIVITIPNLHTKDYGVDGTLTRQQWQEECYAKLMAGPDVFNTWSNELEEVFKKTRSNMVQNFDIEIKNPENPDASIRIGWSSQPLFVADFSNRVFDNNMFLEDYVFNNGAIFSGAVFKGIASFNNVSFKKDVFFHNVEFRDAAIFANSHFSMGPIFNNAIFKKFAVFNYCTFAGATLFKDVCFEDDAYFKGSIINFANFDGSVFMKRVDLSGDSATGKELKTFGPVSFSGVQFYDRADFSNRKFTGKTDFDIVNGRRATFHIAPLFHNCELHQDTTFLNTIFHNNAPDPLAAKAFNTLRNSMSKQQATREEQRFLILELDSEKLTSNGGGKNLYAIYKYIANYGFSVGRPILLLILLPGLISALIYGFIVSWSNCGSLSIHTCQFDLSLCLKILKFSLLQSLPPIGFDRLIYQLGNEIKNHNILFDFLVIIQKVLSLAGWFFVALALRNMFKMK